MIKNSKLNFQDKRVLVTGGAGFIGSHLAELCVEQGFDVRAFDRYNPNNHWGWLENSKYKNDNSPIDESIVLRSLNKYSKNYINHLINSNEILASMILTMNNIVFYQELMKKIRIAIKTNTFNVFYNKYINVI